MNWPASEFDTRRVREAMRAYLATLEGLKRLREVYPIEQDPLWLTVLAVAFGVLTRKIKLGDYMRAQRVIAEYKRFAKDLDGFLSRAKLVQGSVVMANEDLLRSGSGNSSAPLLAMVGFSAADERFVHSEEWQEACDNASFMVAEGDAGHESTDHQILTRLMTDDVNFGNVRREAPKSLTRGHSVNFVSVWAHRAWFESSRYPLRIPLLAEPGPSGVCLQVPHWIEAGTPSPAAD
jgi:hypothetical protein